MDCLRESSSHGVSRGGGGESEDEERDKDEEGKERVEVRNRRGKWREGVSDGREAMTEEGE